MRKRQNGFESYFPPAERAYTDYLQANQQSMLGAASRSATPARAAPQAQGTMSVARPRPKPGQRTFEKPNARDLDHLVLNPHLRNEFEYVFGPAEQYLTPDQMIDLPDRAWDPWTMPRPTRGYVEYPPRGGGFTDHSGERLPRDRLPTGSYKLPDPAPDKVLPLENSVLPTQDTVSSPRVRNSFGNYSSGVYDPFGLYREDGGRRPHFGPDMPAPPGAPVRAAASGKAFRYRNVDGLGDVVAIQHADGTATLYAHLGAFNVKDGDMVMAGDQIGAVGATGNATNKKTGVSKPQLHFEVFEPDPTLPTPVPKLGRKTQDPIEWLKRPYWYRGSPLPLK